MKQGFIRAFVYGALLCLTFGNPAFAQGGDQVEQGPSGFEMAGDAVVARPLLLATTILGAGVFLISLPFSALGGNVGEAGEALVTGPAKATFKRCLGCTQ